MNNPLFTGSAKFCYLVPKHLKEDERQTAYLAIIEANPDTAEDALSVLSALHHKTEKQARMQRVRNIPLEFEPAAEQRQDHDSRAMQALDLLPADDQVLIQQHVIEGTSMADLAKVAGVSRETIRKRYNTALAKLRVLNK